MILFQVALSALPVQKNNDPPTIRQIRRITDSELLRGSEALCRILRFLGEQALAHPGTPVKEYVLATQVLGRPEKHDPRFNASVRVQVGRLRSKLAQYYSSQGVSDPLVISIPRGAYMLSIFERELIATEEEDPTPLEPVLLPTPPATSRFGIAAVAAACLLLGIALGVAVGFVI